MKVIGINGSARRDGNTAILLRSVLAVLNDEGIETELLQLAGTELAPCKACWACCGGRGCVQRDGFAKVFEKMRSADGILLGSPVYLANVSSRMQAFLERAAVVCSMNPGMMRHKAGAAVAAVRRGGALNAVDAMNHFFLTNEMFVVGSTYWNMAYGRLPGEVEGDGEGMANMENLGRNMAALLKALNVQKG